MEYKKNVKNLDIQLNLPKTNPPPAPLQFMDDSETNESSQKCKTEYSDKKSSIDYLTINFKRSLGFFPKKNLYMEDIDTNIYDKKRKYSMEEKLVIKKDFVPQLRPIEIHLVPSKLRLNKKGFKDLKRNKKNKILLDSNKYFISCPNLEDEEDEDDNYNEDKDKNTFESSNDIISLNINKSKNNKISNINENKQSWDIKEIRKFLQKIKQQNIQKIYSKKVINKDNYEKSFNLGNSSESDLDDFDEIDDYSLLEYEKKEENKNENTNKKDKNKKNRNRTYSVSILEMLQKKFEIEDE